MNPPKPIITMMTHQSLGRGWYNPVEKAIAVRNEAFIELLQGPNPITAPELRKLILKRPSLWGQFAYYLPENGGSLTEGAQQ